MGKRTPSCSNARALVSWMEPSKSLSKERSVHKAETMALHKKPLGIVLHWLAGKAN